MIDDLNADPLLRQLTDLPPMTPDAARGRRVVSRCHAALAHQLRSRARAKRMQAAVGHALDMALATTVAVYAIAAVTEAIRLTLMQ